MGWADNLFRRELAYTASKCRDPATDTIAGPVIVSVGALLILAAAKGVSLER